MKRINLMVAICLLSIMTYGQEFLGVKVDGTKQEVINKFIAKGFRVVPIKNGIQTATTMKGNYAGTNYEIIIINTPITKKVWKIAVYLPEQISWYSLKSEYNKYLEILTSKYGQPDNSYDFFSSPYYEGDGYEMTALAIEKCNYASYWLDVIISIEISKYKQIKISYENKANSDLDDQEKEKLNKNVF